MSNIYCHPGRAGGPPLLASTRFTSSEMSKLDFDVVVLAQFKLT